jgi:hypothetical protein
MTTNVIKQYMYKLNTFWCKINLYVNPYELAWYLKKNYECPIVLLADVLTGAYPARLTTYIGLFRYFIHYHINISIWRQFSKVDAFKTRFAVKKVNFYKSQEDIVNPSKKNFIKFWWKRHSLWKFIKPLTCTLQNQNQDLLWKIAVLGMGKAPFWCGSILALAYAGNLHSSMP